MSLLKKTERGLQSYRASDFVTAKMAAKNMCEEINVEAVLKQKWRHFSYESHDEPFSDALRKLEVGFVNVVVDAATSAITERFSTFENMGKIFGVLINVPSNTLGTTLHYEGHSDLDSRSLCRSPAIKNHEPP